VRGVTPCLYLVSRSNRPAVGRARGNEATVSEETLCRTMELDEGTDWVWFPDLNMIGLSSRLDCAGRERAIDEMQRQWRRAHLRTVESA
jgi:hypothetical protein